MRRTIRRRRVRLAYPEAFQYLIAQLASMMNVAQLAHFADVPKSAIYRWRGRSVPECFTVPVAKLVEIASSSSNSRGHSAIYAANGVPLIDQWNEPLQSVRNTPTQHQSSATKSEIFLLGDSEDELHSDAIRPDHMRGLIVARKIIRTRYFDALACAELGAAAGMSRDYFIRSFRSAYGLSPYQYLQRIRIAAAKKLLAQTGESMDVIAAGVGFKDGAALGRVYRRVEGVNASCVHGYIPQNDTHQTVSDNG